METTVLRIAWRMWTQVHLCSHFQTIQTQIAVEFEDLDAFHNILTLNGTLVFEDNLRALVLKAQAPDLTELVYSYDRKSPLPMCRSGDETTRLLS